MQYAVLRSVPTSTINEGHRNHQPPMPAIPVMPPHAGNQQRHPPPQGNPQQFNRGGPGPPRNGPPPQNYAIDAHKRGGMGPLPAPVSLSSRRSDPAIRAPQRRRFPTPTHRPMLSQRAPTTSRLVRAWVRWPWPPPSAGPIYAAPCPPTIWCRPPGGQ